MFAEVEYGKRSIESFLFRFGSDEPILILLFAFVKRFYAYFLKKFNIFSILC